MRGDGMCDGHAAMRGAGMWVGAQAVWCTCRMPTCGMLSCGIISMQVLSCFMLAASAVMLSCIEHA